MWRAFAMYFSTKTPAFEKRFCEARGDKQKLRGMRAREAHLAEVGRALESLLELLLAPADAHAHATATGSRLEEDRVANFARLFERQLERFDEFRAGEDGHVCGDRTRSRFVLKTHRLDLRRRRSEPDDAGFLDLGRERLILAEKAVSWVDHRDALLAADLEDGFLVNVGGHEGGFVGLEDVRSGCVRVHVHRDRSDLERGGRAQDAQGNLAAIGDQELVLLGRRHGERGI